MWQGRIVGWNLPGNKIAEYSAIIFLFQGQLEIFPGRSVLGSTWDDPGLIFGSISTPNCSLWLAVTN